MKTFFTVNSKQVSTNLDRPLTLKRLRGIKAHTMLDLGAHNCTFTEKMARVVGATEVHGIDIDNYYEGNTEMDIKLTLGDLNNNLPYQSNYFDLVTSRHNIEHLVDTDRNLSEVYRVLKPGGHFLIHTVNLAALHYRFLLLFGFLPNCTAPSRYKITPFKGMHEEFPHKSVFTYKALLEVLKHHGFEIVNGRTHTIYPLPPVLGNMICRILPNWGLFMSILAKKPETKN